MAVPADALWAVQSSSSSDSNGGAWANSQKGATGTDHSQGSATSFTLTTAGTTSIVATSGAFDNTMLGNGINITGDGIYILVGFTNSTHMTVDRNTGTGTGISAKVGGPLATPGAAGQFMAANNIIWCKVATYTCTTDTYNVPGGKLNLPAGAAIFGFTSTRGDAPAFGSRPIMVGTGDSFSNQIIATAAGSAIRWMRLKNAAQFEFLCNGSGKAVDSDADSMNNKLGFACMHCVRCYSPNFGQPCVTCIDCVAHDSANGAGFNASSVSNPTYIRCIAINCPFGWQVGTFAGQITMVNCVADLCGYGIMCSSDNTIGDYNLSLDAIFDGVITSRSTTKGWDLGTVPVGGIETKNCYSYGDAANSFGAIGSGSAPSILGSDPFTTIGSDFTLKSASGIRQTTQSTYPTLSNTTYLDPGLIQHQDSGGGGSTFINNGIKTGGKL